MQFLTTKELATLLRIKERKVYELVAEGSVPCSRATGKLLFPKQEIEQWIQSHSTGFKSQNVNKPGVVLGSHDPLLDWAIRESGCGLATFFDGSSDGLKRFFAAEGVATGLHLYHAESDSWNVEFIQQNSNDASATLLEFVWRRRGLIFSKTLAPRINQLSDLVGHKVATRQTGAGAELLLTQLLQKEGINPEQLNIVYRARTETEAATAVSTQEADICFGLESVAREFNLEFLPIIEERFDLLVDQFSWFEPPLQKLFNFFRTEMFIEKVSSMQGYELRFPEKVHLNF